MWRLAPERYFRHNCEIKMSQKPLTCVLINHCAEHHYAGVNMSIRLNETAVERRIGNHACKARSQAVAAVNRACKSID
jgi:hypothetical protein